MVSRPERLRRKLEIKQKRLEDLYRCEAAIMTSQSYTIDDRVLTRANLAAVESAIDKLEDEIADIEAQLDGKKPRAAVAMVPQDW